MIKPRALRVKESKTLSKVEERLYSFEELKAECKRLGIN